MSDHVESSLGAHGPGMFAGATGLPDDGTGSVGIGIALVRMIDATPVGVLIQFAYGWIMLTDPEQIAALGVGLVELSETLAHAQVAGSN